MSEENQETYENKELVESNITAIERLATNPDVDPEKLQKFMDMQEHVLDRNAKQLFNIAMVQVQSKIPEVPRDKVNNGTKPPSKYSSYEMIMKHCKPVYTSEGFAISAYEGTQIKEGEEFPPIAAGEVRIFGDVMHEGGWSKTYYVDIPLDDKGPQGTKNKTMPHAKKSSLSYGRSALMCMILNIPTGDGDDGNAAGKPQAEPEPITDKQAEQIFKLQEQGNILSEDFTARLKKKFGVDNVDRLDTDQANELINALKIVAGKMPEIIRGIAQNTPEWMALRIASVGSTAINEIAPKGTGYENKLYKLAGELVTGVKSKSKTFQYADRGHEFQPAATEMYELVNGVEVEQICMIRGDKPHTHTSTDGLVGTDGIFEAKVRIPSEFIKLAEGKAPPIGDFRQAYWGLYISEREWVDCVNYCPEIAAANRGGYLEKRIHKNECELLIKELANTADTFIKDMLKLAEKFGIMRHDV